MDRNPVRAVAFCLCASLCSVSALHAERIMRYDYAASAARADTYVNFDEMFEGVSLPRRIDALLEVSCLTFGERFAGQKVTRYTGRAFPNERLSDGASAPLTVLPGGVTSNLALYRNKGFNRNTLGGRSLARNGEGSMAIRFGVPQSHIAFANHASSLPGYDTRGRLHLMVFGEDAGLLATLSIPLDERGVLAFRTRSGATAIGGISLHSSDGGGVSFYDFHATCTAMPVS